MDRSKAPNILVLLFLLIGISGATSPVHSQDVSLKMDKIVQDYAGRKQFMGSVLVARNGNILPDKAYGYANLEWDIPNTPTTKFRIASLTKQFTAASIFLLQKRGKLNIDDSVKKYVPDAPTTRDKVTIYNLMTHTSGIPNSYDGITSWSYKEFVSENIFKPLDMKDSGCVSNSEVIRQRASGYQMGPVGPENARYYNETLLFVRQPESVTHLAKFHDVHL